MYEELLEEGYNDIRIMGINGKQYDYTSDTCMLCDCESGSCVEDRILPWTQDTLVQIIEIDYTIYEEFDDMLTCAGEGYLWNPDGYCYDPFSAEYNCESSGEYIWHGHDSYCFEPYVWKLWDVLIRDFFILDRDGNLVFKINLTYNNPDQNENCGNNYQLIKNLLIESR